MVLRGLHDLRLARKMVWFLDDQLLADTSTRYWADFGIVDMASFGRSMHSFNEAIDHRFLGDVSTAHV